MRKILIHIALIIMLFSCEEKIDFDAESQETIRLVVEGMITNEIKAHEVKLSLPVKIRKIPASISQTIQFKVFLGNSIHYIYAFRIMNLQEVLLWFRSNQCSH